MNGKLELAKASMEQAIRIMDEYGLVYYHDSIVQITNYAVLLTDLGQPDIGLSALRKLCCVIREYNSDAGLDYACVQQAMGNICLTMGEIQQATSHFKKAMEIYETVFEFEPDMIETKKQMRKNEHIQIVAKKTESREWIRMTGIATECDNQDLKQRMLEECPVLQQRFGAVGIEHFIMFKVKVENVEIK